MTHSNSDLPLGELHDGSPRQRRERAALWVPVLEADIEAQSQRLDQVAETYRDALELRTGVEARPTDLPHVDPEAKRQTRWVRVGGFAVLAIEVILAVGLAIWSLTLWPLISGVIGATVAVGWTLGTLGVHYARVKAKRPEAALRGARRAVWWSFLVGLAGFAPLLLARSVPEAAALTGIATAVISLGFSSMAAYLFLLAFLIGWAAPYAAEYEGLQGDIARTRQLVQESREIAAGRFPLRRGPQEPSKEVAA